MAKGGSITPGAPARAGAGRPQGTTQRETGSRGRDLTKRSHAAGFVDEGPKKFIGTRATPVACDYDGAHGVPASHPTARNAASNMLDQRAKRTRPVDREQNDGGVGISLTGFTRDAK